MSEDTTYLLYQSSNVMYLVPQCEVTAQQYVFYYKKKQPRLIN